MLGYIVTDQRGVLDAMLLQIAERLRAEGLRLAGAVQENPVPEDRADTRCDMVLRLLGTSRTICISQRLGAHARGCRLDPGALEEAAAAVEHRLTDRPDLLIVNKFGKAEMDGHGFRPVIASALGEGIPVLTAVGRGGLPGFDSFVDGLGTPLPFALDPVLDWCRHAVAEAATDVADPVPAAKATTHPRP